jgi:uncharacterized membrane protein HdeD (DUF308 family)
VLVFITSYMTRSRGAKIALRVQGVIGITLGILLYRVFFIQVRLQWFLLLIAIQALSTAVAEGVVSHHSQTLATSRWNLVAAGIAFGFSLAYTYILVTLGAQMETYEITWMVFAYLITFGLAESITAARMLYADYQLALA